MSDLRAISRPLTAGHASPPPTPIVPDYELLRRIGGGAYGEVWLARNRATGVLRAAKIVWRHTFEDERPFQREFVGIQKYEPISREHPSQLALFHVGRNEAEGYFYYIMELADTLAEPNPELGISNFGRLSDFDLRPAAFYSAHTLRAELAQGRLSAARVLELGLALTEALGHLHRQGLVHRDVKPSNVIFVNGRPKLADIGLVTDASDQCSIVGTEGYLPPEGPGTPQADIFALGKVLYEATTGMDRRQFPDLPPDLRAWPEVNSVLEINQVVLRACAADIRARYQHAEEVRTDLLQLKGSKSLVRTRRLERQWRNVRRGAAWMAVAAAVVGFLVLADRVLWKRRDQTSQRSAREPAYLFYTTGRSYLDQFKGARDMQMAADFFARSTNAEPGFGPAYGCLAYTYTIWTLDGWNPLWKDLPKAKDYALVSLKLEDGAEAHLALAWYYALKEWRWGDAQSEQEKALKLQPSSALCRWSHAEFLRDLGQVDEALKELNEALRIQPHPQFALLRLPAFLTDARRYQEALEVIDQARASVPITASYFNERTALCALKRYDDALELERKFRVANGEPQDVVDQELKLLKEALTKEGPKADWRAKLRTTQGYERACCYAQLDQKDEALKLLENARNRKDVILTLHVMTDWRLDPLRSEPRFTNLLTTMHLPVTDFRR